LGSAQKRRIQAKFRDLHQDDFDNLAVKIEKKGEEFSCIH